MIVDMINDKRLNRMETKLLIRGRKLKTSIVFVMQSYFRVRKEVLF